MMTRPSRDSSFSPLPVVKVFNIPREGGGTSICSKAAGFLRAAPPHLRSWCTTNLSCCLVLQTTIEFLRSKEFFDLEIKFNFLLYFCGKGVILQVLTPSGLKSIRFGDNFHHLNVPYSFLLADFE